MPDRIDSVLPDLVDPNLLVLFCGSAASTKSSILKAYYAGPGNRFWWTLHEIGLTPCLLQPDMFRELSEYNIGLTDLAKYSSGPDHTLPTGSYNSSLLSQKLNRFSPSVLAFNGKTPAQNFLQQKTQYGRQQNRHGDTVIFVLPSTSGAARRYWSIEPWRELAEFTKTFEPSRKTPC